MADTFGSVWRQVRLYCPLAPALLVQTWVKNATRQYSDERNWSFLRSEGEFVLAASKAGTVVLVHGSATVDSTGGATGITFAATDVGRQLQLGSGPPITITAVSLVAPTSATLERAWQGDASASISVTVADLYATCPADFGHFIAVLDPQNQRQIRVFMTELELNASDPSRTDSSDPWALVSYRLSALPSTLGRVQYEWRPYWVGSTTRRYPFYYFRRPADPAEDDEFLGPLRARGDVILTGALAEAARWPGLAGSPNPYFNLALSGQLRAQFEKDMAMLEVRDEEIYMTWLDDQNWAQRGGHGSRPTDAAYLQCHE